MANPKSKIQDPKCWRRILVIRGGAIGDFVLTLPALRALRVTFPDAWIEIMGYPTIAEMALQRYYADSLSRVDSAEMTPFFVPGAELPERQVTHLKTFDTAIVFWKDEPSTLAPNQLVGSGLTANLRRAGVREVFAVNPFPPAGQKTHAATHMLQALEPIVGRGHDPVPRIFLSAADKTFGANFIAQMGLKGFGGGLIAAHPGSGGKHKRWPASHFAELMERARHRQTRMSAPHGAQWLLICGPADEQACEEVCADLRLVTPHIVKDVSLVQLAAVISECRAYVGNDSGVTHIAAAVGAPTVAVFGPTDPNVWGPVGERVRVAAPHAIVASATPTPGTTVLWPSVEQVWQALAAMCSYHS